MVDLKESYTSEQKEFNKRRGEGLTGQQPI